MHVVRLRCRAGGAGFSRGGLRLHEAHGFLAAQDGAGEVGVAHLDHLGGLDGHGGSREETIPSVVGPSVDDADGGRGVIAERVDVSRVGDVTCGAADARARKFSAEGSDGGVDARLRATADAHAIAAGEKLARHGVADALSGAGDDDAEATLRGGGVRGAAGAGGGGGGEVAAVGVARGEARGAERRTTCVAGDVATRRRIRMRREARGRGEARRRERGHGRPREDGRGGVGGVRARRGWRHLAGISGAGRWTDDA